MTRRVQQSCRRCPAYHHPPSSILASAARRRSYADPAGGEIYPGRPHHRRAQVVGLAIGAGASMRPSRTKNSGVPRADYQGAILRSRSFAAAGTWLAIAGRQPVTRSSARQRMSSIRTNASLCPCQRARATLRLSPYRTSIIEPSRGALLMSMKDIARVMS
jgi:hypothetical protein